MTHRLVDYTVIREEDGITARCECGWVSRGHFSSLAASAAFREHCIHSDPHPDISEAVRKQIEAEMDGENWKTTDRPKK